MTLELDEEQFRHECEVRCVADMPTDADRSAHLGLAREKRGDAVAEKLRRDVWAEMQRRGKVDAD